MRNIGGKSVRRRLEKLEKEARIWKFMAAAALGGLGIVILAGMGGERVTKEVRARKFSLVDEFGTVRMVMRTEDMESRGASFSMTNLEIMDRDGKRRLALGEYPGATELRIQDQHGKPNVVMSVESDGMPSLTLVDGDGYRSALGGVTFDSVNLTERRSAASLVLFDREGKVIWKAGQHALLQNRNAR